ncbi:MAG: hypothetical protein IJ446_01980 [Oscillospiraceae bacterium]|nr:hypothetical protein [Oscillospiraceae bacterium]
MEQNITASNSETFERLITNIIAQVKKYPPYTDEEYPPDYADGSRGLDINRIQSTDYIRILKKHNDDFENILNEVLK